LRSDETRDIVFEADVNLVTPFLTGTC